nr:hypothetical protein GCM10020092_031470 [Actinoplanes digitatis]
MTPRPAESPESEYNSTLEDRVEAFVESPEATDELLREYLTQLFVGMADDSWTDGAEHICCYRSGLAFSSFFVVEHFE